MTKRLLYRPELLDLVGLSYPTIWSMMRSGTFPRSRRVGARVAWFESEIHAWLEKLPIQRLKGDADLIVEHTNRKKKISK